MKVIDMGLNTEPAFTKADRAIENWKKNDCSDEQREKMIKYWEEERERTLELKAQIEKAIEEDGECRLSWSCEGRTRHEMHANQWRVALEDKGWDWDIDYTSYRCVVRR